MPKVPSEDWNDYYEEISEELGDAFFSYDPLYPTEEQEVQKVVKEKPKKPKEDLPKKKFKKEFHIYSVRGKKLKSNQITALLGQHKHPCGYLRSLHLYNSQDGEVLTGLCALTEFFEPCQYPRILRNPSRNDCPIYVASEKEYERRAKIGLEICRRTG